jgi:hypothetical protein
VTSCSTIWGGTAHLFSQEQTEKTEKIPWLNSSPRALKKTFDAPFPLLPPVQQFGGAAADPLLLPVTKLLLLG